MVKFSAGDPVPEWVFRATPERYQRRVRFSIQVDVRTVGDTIAIVPRNEKFDSIIYFEQEWWRLAIRRVFPRFPKAKIRIEGAPTAFVGAKRMVGED